MMKSFNYTQTLENTPQAPEKEQLSPVQDNVALETEDKRPQTMQEAIEVERQKALKREAERHTQIKDAIHAKFDELKRVESAREETVEKALDQAEEDLKEIDRLINERRTGIFEEVSRIAQAFNEKFN